MMEELWLQLRLARAFAGIDGDIDDINWGEPSHRYFVLRDEMVNRFICTMGGYGPALNYVLNEIDPFFIRHGL